MLLWIKDVHAHTHAVTFIYRVSTELGSDRNPVLNGTIGSISTRNRRHKSEGCLPREYPLDIIPHASHCASYFIGETRMMGRRGQNESENTFKSKSYHGNKTQKSSTEWQLGPQQQKAVICKCAWACTSRFSRVLAHPQVLEGEQAAGIQWHQDIVSLHYVQAEGPDANDDPLRLRPQGQNNSALILRQNWQAVAEREQKERYRY